MIFDGRLLPSLCHTAKMAAKIPGVLNFSPDAAGLLAKIQLNRLT